MSLPPRLTPLTGNQGLWVAQKPGFAALANSALGDSGSSADGTDNLISSLLHAFSAASPLLDAISAAGTDLAAAQTATNAIKLPDLDAAIAAATAASNGSITKLGKMLGLLTTSPTWTAGIGPPPSPPGIDVAGTTTPGGSSGTSAFSEATYSEATSTAALGILQGLAQSSPGLAAMMPALTVAIPIIGAAIGVALILVHYLGHGCGEPCIDAAKAEQIYEAAADDIFAVYKLGMITAVQAVAIMTHMFAAGTQHMASFNTSQANKGAMNMQKVLSALIAQVPHTPQAKSTPLNLNTAHIDYVSGPGWYPDSLQQASPLADEYLTALSSQKGA
jgi:hypothetical protein